MNSPETNASPGQNARLLLKSLHEQYPVFSDHAPLAIGIDKQVQARDPAINKKLLRIALSMHTNSLRYLKTMEKSTHRLDLDGKAIEELTEAHRKYATEVLRERSKKNAERLRLQREQTESEARERQRSEKLNQLVERFGKGVDKGVGKGTAGKGQPR